MNRLISQIPQCICLVSHNIQFAGLAPDIFKMKSWTHMGRTANIIIKDIIHIFASIFKNMRILLMGRRYCERWIWNKNVHNSILNGVLWYMGQVHCGFVRLVYFILILKYHRNNTWSIQIIKIPKKACQLTTNGIFHLKSRHVIIN